MSLCDQYPKIRSICTDQQSLVDAIKKMSRVVLRHTVAFAMLNEKQGQKTTRKVSKHVSSFLRYQMLIDTLKKLPQTEQAKRDMIDKCEDYYHSNRLQLTKIKITLKLFLITKPT